MEGKKLEYAAILSPDGDDGVYLFGHAWSMVMTTTGGYSSETAYQYGHSRCQQPVCIDTVL